MSIKRELEGNINDSIKIILERGKNYGRSNYGNDRKINIEYGTSADINTIYGDSLARIMSFIGYDVTREYFVRENAEVIDEIQKELDDIRINFDLFTKEKDLYDGGIVDTTLVLLQQSGKCYIDNNNLWLKTTDLFDSEDRLLIKSDGSYASFLTDLSYHVCRLKKNYDSIIDIVYDDSIEYFNGIKSGICFAGYDQNKLKIIHLSKKNDVNCDDVNKLRYNFISDNLNSVQDNNLICYIEKAYSKICLLLRGKTYNYSTIGDESAYTILNKLIQFEEIVIEASSGNINIISNYLYELAVLYYNYEAVMTTNEYINLLFAIKIVMDNAASMLGLILREEM